MNNLSNLKSLYIDMLEKNETACVFNINYHSHPFRCLFLCDINNRDLFVSKTGQNAFTIHIIIPKNFILDTFFIPNQKYALLVDYLELTWDYKNPFKPINFLVEISTLFPTTFQKKPTIRERYQTVRRSLSSYNGEKYFKGWIHWNKKNTSYENMLLTSSLVGYKNALLFQENNISSAWSVFEKDENLDALENWKDFIDF